MDKGHRAIHDDNRRDQPEIDLANEGTFCTFSFIGAQGLHILRRLSLWIHHDSDIFFEFSDRYLDTGRRILFGVMDIIMGHLVRRHCRKGATVFLRKLSGLTSRRFDLDRRFVQGPLQRTQQRGYMDGRGSQDLKHTLPRSDSHTSHHSHCVRQIIM